MNSAIINYMDYISVTKTKGTYIYYKQYFEEIKSILGHYECEEISNIILVSFIKKQKERNPEISNATLNKFVGAIKSLVNYTCDKKIKFSKLKEQKKIIPTISNNTITTLFNFYQKHTKDKHDYRNYLFLKMLLDTGLRMNEMINLKFKDIDFFTNTIHVKVTKTSTDRYVCFTDSTSSLLKKYIVANKIDGLLFYEFGTKNKMTTSSVESFIYRIKGKLNIKENITPHKWRHTFATNYLKNGGDLETLRLLLGHSNLKTTQKYLHLNKTDIIESYKAVMNKIL